jgi:hypothetical protein
MTEPRLDLFARIADDTPMVRTHVDYGSPGGYALTVALLPLSDFIDVGLGGVLPDANEVAIADDELAFVVFVRARWCRSARKRTCTRSGSWT